MARHSAVYLRAGITTYDVSEGTVLGIGSRVGSSAAISSFFIMPSIHVYVMWVGFMHGT